MGKIIELTVSNRYILNAYVAFPTTRPRAGIVVIQEVFGVNQHIKDITNRFAEEQNYIAIAPSLFDRIETGVSLDYSQESLSKGRILRSILGWDKPLLDINTAREFILSYQGSQLKVGVIGFCWGGSLSWLSACRLPFHVSVCYYGGQIVQFLDEYPSCPVMMHFGIHDNIISEQDRKEIIKSHPSTICHLYDAGHGFNCNERTDFRKDCADQAWVRTKDFLLKNLS